MTDVNGTGKLPMIRRENGQIIGTPETARRASEGRRAQREARQAAAEASAREALRVMLERLPPDQVQRYAVRKGKEYLAAWAVICEEQAFKAAEGADTRAAQFVGKAAGLLPDARDSGKLATIGGSGDIQNLPPEELGELLAMFRAAKAENPALAERARRLLEAE